MKERPILFSGPMVRAILGGNKSQTRRVVKLRDFGASECPGYDWDFRDRRGQWNSLYHEDLLARCPYGVPGDLLWVRETWAADGDTVAYRADYGDRFQGAHLQPWHPSIHMPRRLSRIQLQVEDVDIDCLQAITGADVLAEGVGEPWNSRGIEAAGGMTAKHESDLRDRFRALWDGINGERAPWAADPWVWVVRFVRRAQ